MRFLFDSMLLQRTYIPLRLAKKQVCCEWMDIFIIPYHTVQISRVVKDMSSMRDSFTAIVSNLDMNYKLIENETQQQFRVYVENMKKEMANKIQLLSQVCMYVCMYTPAPSLLDFKLSTFPFTGNESRSI